MVPLPPTFKILTIQVSALNYFDAQRQEVYFVHFALSLLEIQVLTFWQPSKAVVELQLVLINRI